MQLKGQPEDGTAQRILSVVIVSYNTCLLTLGCLRSLYSELAALNAEVFVVDNASADDTCIAVQAAFPDVKLIPNLRNKGFAAANNQAIRECTGGFILLLNSDAFPQPGSIASLISYLKEHPSAGIAGPRLLNGDGSLQRSCYRFPSPMRVLAENLLLTAAFPNNRFVGDYRAWQHDVERDVDFVIGACMLVRRSAMEEVGLFDEDFFLYAEETDWCNRFWQRGWRVAFVPGAEVVHLNGGSGGQQPDRVFNEFRRSGERYIRKHYGGGGLWIYRGSLLMGAALRIASFSLASLVPSRRKRSKTLIEQWMRIFSWTIGFRGPGLSDS